MEKTTANIIYLYNNIEECVKKYEGTIDEHTWLCIETAFQPKVGEVFEVSIKQADLEDRNMWNMVGLVEVDYSPETLEEGKLQFLPIVSKISQVMDEWFRYNNK